MNPKAPEQVDRDIGKAIRARRTALGLSQTKLGEAAGVTFQQVQKYENGLNRVSGSRLSKIALALACRPSDLVDGEALPGIAAATPEGILLQSNDGARLARAFAAIPVGPQRRALLEFVEAMAHPE
ncbi:helix-turn-helix domain-containing protein [uncultured Enterovirga sp.]|uniref:helix-turn-helix domain-containing protein n=1 Tax=uncultured Enterovirga sp. TaxID=2026352 RepID=UPI0035CB83CC